MSPSLRLEGGCSSAGKSHGCLPFLSKVSINRGAGDRTDAAPGGAAITVAGLCRSYTGFATTRRRSLWPECSTAAPGNRQMSRR